MNPSDAIIALFAPEIPSKETINKYLDCLAKFDSEWRHCRATLGSDWHYAESLRAAGLLEQDTKPYFHHDKQAGIYVTGNFRRTQP